MAIAATVLCGCETAPVETTSVTAAPATAAAGTAKRYIIDSQASEIRLLVYRDGPMARFGHNHVMTGPVRGELSLSQSAAGGGFWIEIPVDSLEVDTPAARAEEGAEFAAPVSDPARKGTRDNMLGPEVLDAGRFPVIRIESVALPGPRWAPAVSARVTVRGTASELEFLAAVFEQADSLTVVASFQVLQSSLGLKPFSVLGGAIKVNDRMTVRVRLVARLTAQ